MKKDLFKDTSNKKLYQLLVFGIIFVSSIILMRETLLYNDKFGRLIYGLSSIPIILGVIFTIRPTMELVDRYTQKLKRKGCSESKTYFLVSAPIVVFLLIWMIITAFIVVKYGTRFEPNPNTLKNKDPIVKEYVN